MTPPADGAGGGDPVVVEEIPAALAGQRVDRVVSLLVGCSRTEAHSLVVDGHVRIDGAAVTKPSLKLDEGQQIELMSLPTVAVEEVLPDPDVEFTVVHDDDQIIVVDKPAGLVVHPGPGHKGSTLVHGLLARYPELVEVGEAMRPGLVHRLDRGTSGLLVVARTPEAYHDLVGQLSSHTVTRVYTALVWRHPEHAHGVVDAPIGRSRRDPLRMTVAIDGRPSRTHYRVEQSFTEPVVASLVTCELETGRTHQIRVHMASIGHAVLGDDLYGGVRHTFEFHRPFLHARELAFVHPGTDELVRFESPLPDDLAAALARFR